MPQIDRHDHTVDQHHASPNPDVIQHPPRLRLQRQRKARLRDAERQQGNRRRHGIAQAFTRNTNHRNRIGTKPNQQSQRNKPAKPPQGGARRAIKIPFIPRITQLMHRQPDKGEVHEIDIGHMKLQRQHIDQHRRCDQHPEARQPPPLPRRIAVWHDRGDHQIDREKPHRDQRELRRQRDNLALHAQHRPEQCEGRPDEEQRQHRIDQSLQPPGEPFGIGAVVTPVGRPAGIIGKAADEEEDRHHLKPPGQPLRPGQNAKQMPALHRAIGQNIGRSDEPMADDHSKDGEGTQKVDVTITFGRRLFGHMPRPRP